MNVKPGDLAYITGFNKYAGHVVEILSRAPIGVDFKLPDGFMQCAQDYEWVVRFCSPVEAPVGLKGVVLRTRATHFGCVPDRVLRPIGGVPIEDEMKDEVPA